MKLAQIFAAVLALVALTSGSDTESDPLTAINRQIANLEAKLAAIEHLKKYAESVNLLEVRNSDIEQAVAHFVKSTRPSFDSQALNKGVNTAQKKNSLAQKGTIEKFVVEPKNKNNSSSVLSHIFGKSMINLDSFDFAYTLLSTRPFKLHMQANIISTIIVVSPRSLSSQATFNMFDQDGTKILEYTLEKQTCEPGAKKEFVR